MNIFNERWLTFWLLPFSLLYFIAVYLRNLLYDFGILPNLKLNVPVISIGNLSVGGTGKTPAVEYIARLLLKNDLRPAIITRGYGRRQLGTVVVSDDKKIQVSVGASGDEAMLLAGRLPHAVVIADEKKFRGAQYADDNFQIDAVIVDDGFQHRKLFRNIDIVLIDAPSFFENHWVLPAGPFREPLGSLSRAHVVIVSNADKSASAKLDALSHQTSNRSSAVTFTSSLAPKFLENVATGEQFPVSFLNEKKVMAACGIARPIQFFETIKNLGAILLDSAAFPDHHDFEKDDIVAVLERAQKARAELTIITEKDATKWRGEIDGRNLPVFYLRVEFDFLDEAKAFDTLILRHSGRQENESTANL